MKRYLKWVFTEYYFKNRVNTLNLLGTIFGLFLGVYVPGPVIEEYMYYDAPLLVVIGTFIATYGFLAGMLWYPTQWYSRKKK